MRLPIDTSAVNFSAATPMASMIPQDALIGATGPISRSLVSARSLTDFEGRTANEDSRRPLLLTVMEAVEVLSIGRTTLYRLMDAGDIRTVRVGSSRRVPMKSLEAYVDRLIEEASTNECAVK
jgi:excisionase family DNA binding protein